MIFVVVVAAAVLVILGASSGKFHRGKNSFYPTWLRMGGRGRGNGQCRDRSCSVAGRTGGWM